ncbi:MAG: HAD-IC family P-type ATPase [Thermoplasmata archaeon]|nr:MAG: HAD-IC family P-type ATPase [Thermoplasmata archaeon]
MIPKKEVLKKFGTSENGLGAEDAAKRLEKYGRNELRVEKKDPKWKKFLRQFSDALVIVLLLAALITAILKPADIDWMVIAAIVIITATIGYMQEEKAEEAIEKLKKMTAPKTMVIRGGKKRELKASELVPGDVIYMESGMIVPADGRVIEASSLKINESALTGESVPEDKSPEVQTEDAPLADRTNMVYMSTITERGNGLAVVTATGMDTEIGHIAGLIQQVERVDTPLQKKLKQLGKRLGIFILIACIVIFVMELARAMDILSLTKILELFETSVSLAVAAIPEGLPAVVTISLALGLKVMANRNVVVRKLPVVETLGSATVICTDKTGTLTTGVMTADVLYIDDTKIEIEGTGYSPKGHFIKGKKKIKPGKEGGAFEQVMLASALCADAVISEEKGKRKVLGDTTEGAIMVMAEKAGFDYEVLRKKYKRVDEKSFDSRRKMMSTVHDFKGTKVTYTKGAPESILKVCVRELRGNSRVELGEDRRKKLQQLTTDMARGGYRTLAFAMSKEGKIEEDMTFLGIVGIRDKVRPEAADAVKTTRRAGIRAIMITGDHRQTAATIGRELGIIKKDNEAINCADLDEMDEKQFKKVLRKVSVYARASPEHKVRIVKGLNEDGEIVAMTGDGVNDAPALKMADIGVAMGITGTDVTKEASDMIITDDNYSSIVAAVEEGRGIYDNIRKVILFLLSCNMSEITFMLVAILAGFPVPLLALQILWINLVTDSFPALALDTEPKEPGLMKRKPRDPQESVITKDMMISIIISAIIITAGTLFMFWYTLPRGIVHARTMALTTMVMFQMWTAIAYRSTTHTMSEIGWFSNPRLLGAIALSIVLMLPILYIPQAQAVFGTVGLSGFEWLEIIIISALGLIVIEVWEWINRHKLHYGTT